MTVRYSYDPYKNKYNTWVKFDDNWEVFIWCTVILKVVYLTILLGGTLSSILTNIQQYIESKYINQR